MACPGHRAERRRSCCPQAIIAALRDHLPGIVTGWAGIFADGTATWYPELAPDEKFTATVLTALIAPERIAESISWAENTTTTAQTAIAQVLGSAHRAISDAQRETVAFNAAREGARPATLWICRLLLGVW